MISVPTEVAIAVVNGGGYGPYPQLLDDPFDATILVVSMTGQERLTCETELELTWSAAVRSLTRQFEWLTNAQPPEAVARMGFAGLWAWRDTQVRRHGPELMVDPLDPATLPKCPYCAPMRHRRLF